MINSRKSFAFALTLMAATMVGGVSAARASNLSSPWSVTNQAYPGGVPFNPALLTDGTVLIYDFNQNWYLLTPDITGSYINGSWSQLASTPAFASVYSESVLPDGTVMVSGYPTSNVACGSAVALTQIYNPANDTWGSPPPPPGFIGALAPTIVRADGILLAGDVCGTQQALYNAATQIWTSTGKHKFDDNTSEDFTLLGDGSVLTVDTYLGTGTCGTGSQRYLASTGAWYTTTAGNTGVQLVNCSQPNPTYSHGPQILRPYGATGVSGADGAVLALGGTNNSSQTQMPSHSAIYQSLTHTWSAGPDLPAVQGQYYNAVNAPAVLLPDGNVFFAGSPNSGAVQVTHFFEFDGTQFTQDADNGDSTGAASDWSFVLLPTGQVLATDGIRVWIYTPTGTGQFAWGPRFGSGGYPHSVIPGSTNPLSGLQFSGVSQANANGSVFSQAATNFPLVRIVNNATGHVFYAPTSGFNNMALSPGTNSTASFTVTLSTETGPSTIAVVANGIASPAWPLNVGNLATRVHPGRSPLSQ